MARVTIGSAIESCVVLISLLYYDGQFDQPCDLFDGAILEQVLR